MKLAEYLIDTAIIHDTQSGFPGLQVHGIEGYNWRSLLLPCTGGHAFVTEVKGFEGYLEYLRSLHIGPTNVTFVTVPELQSLLGAVIADEQVARAVAQSSRLSLFSASNEIEEAIKSTDWRERFRLPSFDVLVSADDKVDFRKTMCELGYEAHLPEGTVCYSPEELAVAVGDFFTRYGKLLIKPARFASGIGFRFCDITKDAIEHGAGLLDEGESAIIVEQDLRSKKSADGSVQLIVTDEGVDIQCHTLQLMEEDRVTHRGNMFSSEGIIPGDDRALLNFVTHLAVEVAEAYAERGFRGYASLDYMMIGEHVVSGEFNGRVTAGMYGVGVLEQLEMQANKKRVCIATANTCTLNEPLTTWEKVEHFFEYNGLLYCAHGEGVIPVMPNLAQIKKIGIVAVASSPERARRLVEKTRRLSAA